MTKQTKTNDEKPRNLIAIQMAVPTSSAWVFQTGEQSWKGKTIVELLHRIQTSSLNIDHISLCFQLDLGDDIHEENKEGTP